MKWMSTLIIKFILKKEILDKENKKSDILQISGKIFDQIDNQNRNVNNSICSLLDFKNSKNG